MLYMMSLAFIALLLSIAICPLVCPKYWSKRYPFVVGILSFYVIVGYLLLNDYVSPVISIVEYLQFILLIVALYVVSGGICIDIKANSTPFVNMFLLLCGACFSNIFGTTGAAALLIRPFIKINKNRLSIYHIVFFIFIVCNVGGALLPVGDPPLFLGFLKGVPFFWTLTHDFLPWCTAVGILLILFYIFDRRNRDDSQMRNNNFSISIGGKRNFIWLICVMLAVFINPVVFSSIPVIYYHGHDIPFIREVLLIVIIICAYKLSDRKILAKNEFSFEPIHELIILFFGIFVTMMPANTVITQIIKDIDTTYINPSLLFWGTAGLSSFLDNAPTYLNMLTISMTSNGADINDYFDVIEYASGGIYDDSISHLKAVSLASVFFGAMTYIGNGPNFMVKAIAEGYGVKMPSFFMYILRYSIPILLPVLIIVWLLFF